METTPLLQEPQKSKLATAWAALSTWLSKLFIIIAIILAFVATYSMFNKHEPPTQDDAVLFIAMTAICWVVSFIIIYALLYLLKNLIIVCLLVAPIVLLVYFIPEMGKNADHPHSKETLFCFICPEQTTKLDSMSKKIDHLDSMLQSIKTKTDSLRR